MDEIGGAWANYRYDHDNDNIWDATDLDDDNDGLSDWFEKNDGNDATGQFDHDNDGLDDHLDDDDDDIREEILGLPEAVTEEEILAVERKRFQRRQRQQLD